MKQLLVLLASMTLLLAACDGTPTSDVEATMQAANAATQAVQLTETPTARPTARPAETPEPTDTPTPTPTNTPAPTATPPKKLTAADVGLPIGPEVESFVYKLCYVNTATHFHAGDLVYFEFGDSPAEYLVYAPADGTVREILDISDLGIGWEIRVETPFILDGQTVWYDMVHHDGPLPGIETGTFVTRGQPIARLFTARDNGRIEKLVDYAFRNGPRGPQPGVEPFHPESYLNAYLLVEDDLMLRTGVTYETCQGNPIP